MDLDGGDIFLRELGLEFLGNERDEGYGVRVLRIFCGIGGSELGVQDFNNFWGEGVEESGEGYNKNNDTGRDSDHEV